MKYLYTYEDLGVYYGYPKCCIKHFIVDNKKDFKLRTKVGNLTGFLPCTECAQKVANGEIELKDLIQSYRKCRHKFPIDNWDIKEK